MSRVYIGNLGDNASKREIEEECKYYGPLKDVWVARNPPGFAFCVFEDRRDADDAVRGLDGKRIGGARVRVEIARGPTRGGRAARLGLTEKCYDCGRVGHFARDCTRKRRRSRSRSPPQRSYRKSRSRSPRYSRRSRSRSHSHERRSRSPSHSRSPSGERKSPSPFREKRRERSRSRSESPKEENNSPKDNGDPPRSPSKSRSPSPAPQNNEGDD